MKLIDKEGKVFGIINVIDLSVLLLVLLVAVGVGYKYSQKSQQTQNVTVEFQVMVPHIRPEIAKAIKIGDKMVQGTSYTSVVVKDVQIKPGYSVNVDAKGQRVESYDPYLVDIYVTNTGKTTLSSASIAMGGQDIRAGKEYFVKSRDYEFKGEIVAVSVKE
ncbi:MAG: DUF4330 domain-containing protein [Peptococcaceae bacterium]|nr:DUF4330 domain-containing protein [Peptococcaceae bacterium]